MNDNQPPFVIHVNEMADYPDAVYIGRGNGRKRLKRSKWANRFKVDDWGRYDAVVMYRALASELPLRDLDELTGKPLACWCRRSDEPRTDDNMCHGDVLVELWEEQNNAQ